MTPNVRACSALLVLLASACAARGDVRLAAGSIDVVASNGACPVVRFAAAELTNFLSRATGRQVPVVGAPRPGRTAILLGDSSGMDVASLSRDAFVVSVGDGRIAIAGRDDPKKDPVQTVVAGRDGRFERGTLFGVYDFLEREIGCRFYFPGELGECVPKFDVKDVGEGVRKVAPAFRVRRWYDGANAKWFEGGKDEAAVRERMTRLNAMRLRMETESIPCCHGQNAFQYVKRFGKTHPEYFMKLKDGTRFNHAIAPGCSHFGQICFSSGAMEEMYQDVKAYLTGKPASSRGLECWGYNCAEGKYVDIMANDAFFSCLCGKCRPRESHSDGVHDASEMVWEETAKIANRLTAEGVGGYVTQMAYPPYRRVPEVAIPSNVLVMVAERGPWAKSDPKGMERDNAELRGWAKKLGRPVWTWTYPGKHMEHVFPGIPNFTPRAVGEYYKAVAPWTFGTFMESETDAYLYNHMNYYMLSRASWDPGFDVDATLDEYYALMYGPAEKPVKAFLEALEEKWVYGIMAKVEDSNVGPKVVPPPETEIWGRLYSMEFLTGARKALEPFAAGDSIYARRVRLVLDNFIKPLEAQSSGFAERLAKIAALKYSAAGDKPMSLVPFRLSKGSDEVRTEATIKRVEDELVVRYKCWEPRMEATHCPLAGKNDTGKNWRNNGVEFFLNVSGDRRTYYQFVVTMKGEMDDMKVVQNGSGTSFPDCDLSWNSGAKVTAGLFDGGYTLEVRIPVGCFGEPAKESFPANFGRDRVLSGEKYSYDIYTWSPFVVGYHDPVGFGTVEPSCDTLELLPGTTEALVAPGAAPATRFAASELTNFLSRVFGAPVPLVTSPTAGRRQIVVGTNEWSKAEGIDPALTGKDDGFVIKATADRVYLCGVDGSYRWYELAFTRKENGGGLLQGRRSSSFAVYEFLERYCDCRFYWPGELGEIVPRADKVEVPLGERAYAPELIIRKYYHPKFSDPPTWKDNGWIEDNEFTESQGLNYSWSRLRMGSFDIPCCHGIVGFEFLRRFGKEHPEWFALKKDGTRFTKYEGYPCSRHGMVCLTSGVMEELYKDVKSYLTGESPDVRKIHKGYGGKWDWSHSFRARKYVDIMPNDNQYKCCCANCRAKYNEKDPSGLYASELVWGYTRDIANRLIREKVPGYVTQMAYEWYSRVPDFDIPTNVMVMVAKTGPYSIRKPEMLARDNAVIRQWKKKVGNVWIWTYPNKYGKLKVVGVPTMTPWAWGKYYKMISPDVFGAFAESECDRFFFNHLNYYVFSRVCWDPSVDVDAIIREYFKRCYGAAAPEAEKFCRELEDKFLDEMVGAYEMTGEGPKAKAPSVHEIWTRIYSPAVLEKWGRLLDAGAAKLAKGSDEARRFKLFRDELLGIMLRTSDEYLSVADATRAAARYKANPPKRNIVRRDMGWYVTKWDNTERIASDRSVKVVSTNGTAVALYYLDGSVADSLKPETRYRISFFVKGKDIVPTRQGGGAGLSLCDAHNNFFPSPSALSGTFDWLHQSFEHKTAPGTNKGGRSYIYLRISGANGTAWFDGVTIEEIPDHLAEPGKCAVVVDSKASKVTRFAAKELAQFLTRRFSGREVPVKTALAEGEFAFVVGDNAWSRAAGLDPTKLPRDGFAVKTAPGRVFICGVDDPKVDIERRMGVRCEMASLFGVYDFLEKVADCRFFFPGELGEIVRKGDDLPIQNLDYTSAPDYTARRIYEGLRCEYFDPSNRVGRAVNLYRMRMETEYIPCCHGLKSHNFINRFGKTHPEYFALQQGVRNVNPNYRYPHQFCFSSRGFRDEMYKDVVKALKGGAKYFDAMPSDEMVPCECKECRAAYATGPKDSPASDLVWGMVGEWGRRLIADGIPGNITLLAYYPYKSVPTVELPTNVQVMVAVFGPFSLSNPDFLAKDDDTIKAWNKKIGHKVWLWTYPHKYDGLDIKGLPNFAMRAWGEYYGKRKDLIFGSFAEAETERWFYNHLNYYVYGKVSWDNSANVERLLADYRMRMFGPTLVEYYMGKFMDSIEEKWTKKVAGRVIDTSVGPKSTPPSDEEIWEKIYSPAVIQSYDKLLKSALDAARKLADPLVARRVELYRKEIYDPLVEASAEYFARKRKVESLPVIKAGTEMPLVPFDMNTNKLFGVKPRDLPERDVGGTARIWKDGKYLRVAFDLVEPHPDKSLAVKRNRDDRMIWQDESVEIHFCPTGDRKLSYQVLINALGSHAEVRRVKVGQSSNMDWSWNPEIVVKTERTRRGWRYDVSIPLDSFEPMAKRVPVELTRSRIMKRPDKYHQLFHTSPMVDEFGDASGFSVVEF